MNEFIRKEDGTGILKIRGKKQETPCFFPTLMFSSEKLRKIDDICQDLIPFIIKARLVNYADIKMNTNFKVKKHVLTFIDSGGFRLKKEGAKVLLKENKIIWHDRDVNIEDVLKVQAESGDMGNTLDFPISPHLKNRDDYVRFNLNLAESSLKKKPDNLFLYGTIQAWDYQLAVNYSKKIVNLPFDGFAIGGLVQFSRHPQKIIDIVTGVRRVIPIERPVHVFGVANHLLIPILIKLGVDTFDSTSYIRLSLNREYYLELCKKRLTISEKIKDMTPPCSCPVCRSNDLTIFLENTIRSYAFLSLHNLYQIINYVHYCKILMVRGELDTLIQNILKEHSNKLTPSNILLSKYKGN